MRFALLIILIAGCSCSEEDDGACSFSSDCADGLACVDGTCQSDADGGQTDAAADASDDAGSEDVAASDTAPDTGDDARCGSTDIPFEYNPPNVLLVMDRSCSMRRLSPDTGVFGTGPDDPETRWNIARTAVLDLMGRFGTRAFWGMMAFPDPREGCDQPVDTEVPPGPGNIMAIETSLRSESVQPFGLCGLDNTDDVTQPRQTPTADALTSALVLPELMSADRASFAIVITDGGVSCAVEDDTLRTITTSLRDAGIPVGVIGFNTGEEVSSLEAIASVGGLDNPAGPPSYYVADDPASLGSVLDEIAERVVSCDFPLGMVPPDPSMLFVNVNDTMEAMDASDGWSYDSGSNTLSFNGALCRRLRRGEVMRLRVSFGCPPEACVPRAEVCNALDEDCDDRVDEDCLL